MRGAVGRARLRQVLQGFEAVPGIVQGAGQGAPGPRVGRDSGVVVPRWYRKGTGQGLAALGGDLAVGDEGGPGSGCRPAGRRILPALVTAAVVALIEELVGVLANLLGAAASSRSTSVRSRWSIRATMKHPGRYEPDRAVGVLRTAADAVNLLQAAEAHSLVDGDWTSTVCHRSAGIRLARGGRPYRDGPPLCGRAAPGQSAPVG